MDNAAQAPAPLILNEIELIDYKEPGSLALSILSPRIKQRSVSLDLLQTPPGLCAWCNTGFIYGRKKKYCSNDCRESALIFCYPQAPAPKIWRLIHRQSFACTLCGESFEDFVLGKIKEYQRSRARWAALGVYDSLPPKATYHYIGHNTGHLLQVDHTIPLFRGGDGIGLRNLQTICVRCHKQKTICERRSASILS